MSASFAVPGAQPAYVNRPPEPAPGGPTERLRKRSRLQGLHGPPGTLSIGVPRKHSNGVRRARLLQVVEQRDAHRVPHEPCGEMAGRAQCRPQHPATLPKPGAAPTRRREWKAGTSALFRRMDRVLRRMVTMDKIVELCKRRA